VSGPTRCPVCHQVLTPETNDDPCPNSPYRHGKHPVFVFENPPAPLRVPHTLPEKTWIVEPEKWESDYRLNVCCNPDCSHYLWAHSTDGRCKVIGCDCRQAVGRMSELSTGA